MAGYAVVIGSREAQRGEETANALRAISPRMNVEGTDNVQAAQAGEIVFITVPYNAQQPLLEAVAAHLAGKTVIDVVSPITFEKGKPVALSVPEGSAAEQALKLLPDSHVVAAFHHVSATDLLVPDRKLEGDVMVCGDHGESKAMVMSLVSAIPSLRPIDGGGLANARYVEELTALLLTINRIYKCRASIKIVGPK